MQRFRQQVIESLTSLDVAVRRVQDEPSGSPLVEIRYESPVGAIIGPSIIPGSFLRVTGKITIGIIPVPGAAVFLRIKGLGFQDIEQQTIANAFGNYWFDFPSFLPGVNSLATVEVEASSVLFGIPANRKASRQLTIGEPIPDDGGLPPDGESDDGLSLIERITQFLRDNPIAVVAGLGILFVATQER